MRKPREKRRCPDGYRIVSDHSLFGIYASMILRCENPNYPLYFGRITVCERWKGYDGFVNWLEDMGPKPPGLSPAGISLYSIDRRNNNGNYEPDNCYWATQSQQIRNSRKNCNKGRVTITDGINRRFIYQNDLIPEGWRLGGLGSFSLSDEGRERLRQARLGKTTHLTESHKKALNSPAAIAKRWATRKAKGASVTSA